MFHKIQAMSETFSSTSIRSILRIPYTFFKHNIKTINNAFFSIKNNDVYASLQALKKEYKQAYAIIYADYVFALQTNDQSLFLKAQQQHCNLVVATAKNIYNLLKIPPEADICVFFSGSFGKLTNIVGSDYDLSFMYAENKRPEFYPIEKKFIKYFCFVVGINDRSELHNATVNRAGIDFFKSTSWKNNTREYLHIQRNIFRVFHNMLYKPRFKKQIILSNKEIQIINISLMSKLSAMFNQVVPKGFFGVVSRLYFRGLEKYTSREPQDVLAYYQAAVEEQYLPILSTTLLPKDATPAVDRVIRDKVSILKNPYRALLHSSPELFSNELIALWVTNNVASVLTQNNFLPAEGVHWINGVRIVAGNTIMQDLLSKTRQFELFLSSTVNVFPDKTRYFSRKYTRIIKDVLRNLTMQLQKETYPDQDDFSLLVANIKNYGYMQALNILDYIRSLQGKPMITTYLEYKLLYSKSSKIDDIYHSLTTLMITRSKILAASEQIGIDTRTVAVKLHSPYGNDLIKVMNTLFNLQIKTSDDLIVLVKTQLLKLYEDLEAFVKEQALEYAIPVELPIANRHPSVK